MADNNSRAGVRYTTPAILEWLHRTHTTHDAALAAAFDAPAQHGMPAIQVGPAEGRLLELLVRLVKATRVVEVGTLAGYSTIRLGRGMAGGGRLWSCELEEHNANVARENIARAGFADRIEVRVGPALKTLPELAAHGPFDVVFVDADKGSYDVYGRWAAEHLRAGGLLIGDNAFFFGQLLDDTPEAAAMRRFHEEAARVMDTVCIPTPDGMLLGIKR